jgi:hypothetical protein
MMRRTLFEASEQCSSPMKRDFAWVAKAGSNPAPAITFFRGRLVRPKKKVPEKYQTFVATV